jgi:hypothetical protein
VAKADEGDRQFKACGAALVANLGPEAGRVSASKSAKQQLLEVRRRWSAARGQAAGGDGWGGAVMVYD